VRKKASSNCLGVVGKAIMVEGNRQVARFVNGKRAHFQCGCHVGGGEKTRTCGWGWDRRGVGGA